LHEEHRGERGQPHADGHRMRPALHNESGETPQDGDLAQPDATDAAEADLTLRHESEGSSEVTREPAEIEERDGAAATHSARRGRSEEPPGASGEGGHHEGAHPSHPSCKISHGHSNDPSRSAS